MSPRVTFEFQLPYKIKEEGRWYIATCPILDVHSQGTTAEKAKSNLVEALQLFFISCFERGTLDQVLKESGFKPLQRKPKPDVLANMIRVPVFLGSSARATAHAH
jgi:predicted RNase H-like HicB family nuclease